MAKDSISTGGLRGAEPPPLENTTATDVAVHEGTVAVPVKQGARREHKATYAKDKMSGGYLVRVIGPHANKFAGKIVPVVRRDDSETPEALETLVWTGKDDGMPASQGRPAIAGTGKPVALYTFTPKPKTDEDILF